MIVPHWVGENIYNSSSFHLFMEERKPTSYCKYLFKDTVLGSYSCNITKRNCTGVAYDNGRSFVKEHLVNNCPAHNVPLEIAVQLVDFKLEKKINGMSIEAEKIKNKLERLDCS